MSTTSWARPHGQMRADAIAWLVNAPDTLLADIRARFGVDATIAEAWRAAARELQPPGYRTPSQRLTVGQRQRREREAIDLARRSPDVTAAGLADRFEVHTSTARTWIWLARRGRGTA